MIVGLAMRENVIMGGFGVGMLKGYVSDVMLAVVFSIFVCVCTSQDTHRIRFCHIDKHNSFKMHTWT